MHIFNNFYSFFFGKERAFLLEFVFLLIDNLRRLCCSNLCLTNDTMKILLVLATILATVSAYCPNGCNKNGSCGLNGETVRSIFFFLFFAFFCILSTFLFLLLLFQLIYHYSQINAFVTIVQMETQRGQGMIAR